MAGRRKTHQPSLYRGLIRDLKAGANPHEILKSARTLEDPYYRSLFMIKLSSDKRIRNDKAQRMAFDSLESSDLEGREWRRGELLSAISKILKRWRDDATDENLSILWDGILHRLRSIENGDVLTDSMVEISKHISCIHFPALLKISISNPDGDLRGPKAVVKNWFGRCSGDDGEFPDPEGDLGGKEVNPRLLGYAAHQALKNGKETLSLRYIEVAIDSFKNTDDGDRIDLLRYFIDCSPYPDGIERINDLLQEMRETEFTSVAYSSLGVRCHREGDIEKAKHYLEIAEKGTADISDAKARSRAYRALAGAVDKLGEGDWVASLINMTTQENIDPGDARLDDWTEGKKPQKDENRIDPEEVNQVEKDGDMGRAVIALYDTYEGSIKSIHHRMIARAAPLCWAFDFDLALIGFPTDNLDRMIDGTIRETNVGKGGEFLRQLVDKGRIQLVEGSWKEPPHDWTGIGLPVATTSNPENQKAVGMEEAVNIAAKNHPLGRVCLIMGLGRRGLPNTMLRSAKYHLELTGVNIPLETSTALGVISERLRAVLDSG